MGMIALSLISLLPSTVHGTATSPVYGISVHDGKVSVLISLNFHQNLTGLQSSFSLPPLRGSLVGLNSTAAQQAVQNATDSKNPRARVNGLVLTASFSPVSNQTKSQWLNLTLGFDIIGIVSNGPLGAEQIDLSWKSFTVLQDLVVGVTEVNNIGPRYIAASAQQIASSQVSSRFITVSLRVDGKLVGPTGFSAAAASFRTMNFSRLATSASTWNEAYDSSSNQIIWSYEAGRSLGLSVNEDVHEPPDVGGGTSNFRYGLFYSLEAQITGPNRSTMKADTMTAIFGDVTETMMGSIIFSIAIPGVGALVYERRLLGKTPRRKPGK